MSRNPISNIDSSSTSISNDSVANGKLALRQSDRWRHEAILQRLVAATHIYFEEVLLVTPLTVAKKAENRHRAQDSISSATPIIVLAVLTNEGFEFIDQQRGKRLENSGASWKSVKRIEAMPGKPTFLAPNVAKHAQHVSIIVEADGDVMEKARSIRAPTRTIGLPARTIEIYTYFEDSKLIYFLRQVWMATHMPEAMPHFYEHEATMINLEDTAKLFYALEKELVGGSTQKNEQQSTDEYAIIGSEYINLIQQRIAPLSELVLTVSHPQMKIFTLQSKKLMDLLHNDLANLQDMRSYIFAKAPLDTVATTLPSCLSFDDELKRMSYFNATRTLLNRILCDSYSIRERINVLHYSAKQSFEETLDDLLMIGMPKLQPHNNSGKKSPSNVHEAVAVSPSQAAHMIMLANEHGLLWVETVSILFELANWCQINHVESYFTGDLLGMRLSVREKPNLLTPSGNSRTISSVYTFGKPEQQQMPQTYMLPRHRICIELITMTAHRLIELATGNLTDPESGWNFYCHANVLSCLCKRSAEVRNLLKNTFSSEFKYTFINKSSNADMFFTAVNSSSPFFFRQGKLKLRHFLVMLGLLKTRRGSQIM